MRLLILLLPIVGSGCCCIPEPSWLSRKLLPDNGEAAVFSGLDGFSSTVGRCNNAGATAYDVSTEVQISTNGYYETKDTDRIASDMQHDVGVYVPADSMHVKVVGHNYDLGRGGFGQMAGPQYEVVGGTVQCGFAVNTTKKEEE